MKYIAFLHSQLHLNSLRAFLKMKNNPAVATGTIILLKIGSEDYLISEKDCKFSNAVILRETVPKQGFISKIWNNISRILYYPMLRLSQKKICDEEDILYCFFPNSGYIRDAKELYGFQKEADAKRIRIVYIEEGIGSYIRDLDRWKERGLDDLQGFRKLLIKTGIKIKRYFEYDNVRKYFLTNGCVDYFCFFENTDGVLSPNKEVCEAFKTVYLDRAKEYDVNVNYNDTIIISNQLIFDGQGYDDDLECFRRIQYICKKYSIKLVIKPHPRDTHLERYKGFDVDCSNKGISQEILIAKSKERPLAIIGFFSTSLITGKLFYDIPAICISKLVEYEKLKGFDEDIINFMETFKTVLDIPQNYEELEGMIAQVGSRVKQTKNGRLPE